MSRDHVDDPPSHVPYSTCLQPVQQPVDCSSGWLRYRDLGNNRLKGGPLPRQWSRIKTLTALSLENNGIVGDLPVEYSTMARLTSASMSGNLLSGPLPLTWSLLNGMRDLDLSGNGLSGPVPEEWSTMTKLWSLNVAESGLDAAIPGAFLRSTRNLVELKAGGNGVGGAIDWQLLPESLQSLHLESAGLSGALPESLSSLSRLQDLYLSGNNWNGTLPTQISVLTDLRILNLGGKYVDNGALSGKLPEEWSALRALEFLSIGGAKSSCGISGSLPTSWSSMQLLNTFSVNYCNITGPLPAAFDSFTSLETLDVSYNGLTGTLPESYSALRALKTLKLHSNHLTGTLPVEYSSFDSIGEFLLYINKLTGTLPSEYTNMRNLFKMSLRTNLISGTIPEAWMGDGFPKMTKIVISDMRLTGTIPDSIADMNPRGLKVLWLGEQQLTGTIPASLSALTRMEQLHIHNTNITGTVPAELSSMSHYLADLSLSANALTGTIPVELCQLSNLKKLRLNGNRLHGAIPDCLAPYNDASSSSAVASLCLPNPDDLICFQCNSSDPSVNPANPKCACPATQTNSFCGSPPPFLLGVDANESSCFNGNPCPIVITVATSPSSPDDADGDESRPPLVMITALGAVAIAALIVLGLFAAKRLQKTPEHSGDLEDQAMSAKSSEAKSKNGSGSNDIGRDDGLTRGMGVTVDLKILQGDGDKGDSISTTSSVHSSSTTDMHERIRELFNKKGLGLVSSSETASNEEVKILELLACGGMARVYKCIWRGATVAQKLMMLPDTPQCMEKIQKKENMMAMEAAISASMCHPNVVQTYSYEVVPVMSNGSKKNSIDKESNAGRKLSNVSSSRTSIGSTSSGKGDQDVIMWEVRIIQEFCAGGTLSTALKAGQISGQSSPGAPPDLETALRLAKEIAAGMHHIHTAGIIHGDLKANNVLLQRSVDGPVAKVADFGLSIKLEEDQTHVSGVTSGTITHMSPELLQHNINSTASDVYAFGIVLYELFMGARAWPGMSSPEIISCVVHQRRRPMFRGMNTPVHVVELATTCWAHDPAVRPKFSDIVKTLDDIWSVYEKGLLRYSSRSSITGSFSSGNTSKRPSFQSGRSYSTADTMDSDERAANFIANLQKNGAVIMS